MYASVQDMLDWLGEVELIRLTAADGELDSVVNQGKVESALRDASALIDTALRRFYVLPLLQVPAEISRMCRLIARHELMSGEGRHISDQARQGYEEAVSWLKRISADEFRLDLPRAGTAPVGRVSDRPRMIGPDTGLYC